MIDNSPKGSTTRPSRWPRSVAELRRRIGRLPAVAAAKEQLRAIQKKAHDRLSKPWLIFPIGAFPSKADLPKISVAVQLHLYYQDLLDEFLFYLSQIPVPFDLFLSLPRDTPGHSELSAKLSTQLPLLGQINIKEVENRGRDLAPVFVTFAEELQRYDIIGHIHTKRSPHNWAKRDWRQFLLCHLLGSPATIASAFRYLSSKPSVGLLFPQYHPSLAKQISWGTNLPRASWLAERLDLTINKRHPGNFPAGSMFWAKSAALRPLLQAGLTREDFEEEQGQVDGTLAHAIERSLPMVCRKAGFSCKQFGLPVAPWLLNFFPKGRPYLSSKDPGQQEAALLAHRNYQGVRDTVICTALAGEYDTLTLPEEINPTYEYVCFSDRPLADLGLWKILPFTYQHADNTRRCRYVKTHLHTYFPEDQRILWIDCNILIRGDLDGYFEKLERSQALVAAVEHPKRRSILEEARECKRLKKDQGSVIDQQVARYTEAAFNPSRIAETGLLFFRGWPLKLQQALDLWWTEIESFSKRDQLSFQYALHTAGVEWLPLLAEGYSTRNHPDFAFFEHRINSQYGITPPNRANSEYRLPPFVAKYSEVRNPTAATKEPASKL